MNDNKNVEVKVNNNKNIMIEYRELIEKYDILCVGDDINNSVHMLGNKNIYFVDEWVFNGSKYKRYDFIFDTMCYEDTIPKIFLFEQDGKLFYKMSKRILSAHVRKIMN